MGQIGDVMDYSKMKKAQLIEEMEALQARVVGLERAEAERKRAEEELRESEGRFREVLEHSQDALYKRNLETGQYEYVSPAIARITGYTPDEVMAMSPDEIDALIHPEDIERINDLRRNMLETTQSHEIVSPAEYRVKCKDGSYRWISDHYALLRDPEGRPSFSVASVRDITERKRAEERLRRRVEELAALQATVLDIAAPHDLPTLLQTIVERAAMLLDASSGGMYLCDPDQEQVRCVVSYNTTHDYTGTVLKYGEGSAGTVAQTGKPLIIDDYRIWAGRAAVYDEERPFTAVLSAPMIWKGQVTGVIHVLGDVESRRFTQADLGLLTLFANHAAIAVENARLYEEAQQEIAERKRAEEELRESEERFRTLFESAPIGISMVNAEGKPLQANRAFQEMFGLTEDELRRMVFWDSTHPDDVEDSLRQFCALLEGESDYLHTEKRYHAKDGHLIWAQVAASTVRDANGQLQYIIAMVEDITERKRAEEMKDNLIRDVSHELKTPLAKMQMSVEQLMEMVEAPSIDRQKVARISEIVTGNVQRLQDTVNSILDLSLLESGQTPYHKTRVQPENLIRQVIVDMRPLVEAKGLELVAELPESLPQVQSDQEKLFHVLTNLVANAVKFTERGKIVISAEGKAHEVEIAVSDSGRGILRKNLDRVFERFWQERPNIPGAGVGLAICKTIVEAHGGKIWAESAGRGRGTTIRFTLPM
jgi:PAS domain S-box-containing protein